MTAGRVTSLPRAKLASSIRQAREELSGVIDGTPLRYSALLSGLMGTDVLLKCENLQRTGSFKLRGAYVRLRRLTQEERALGVVAASAGNHAQGVALAAETLRTTATIFMPMAAALPKISATESYGAQVILRGATVDEALDDAAEYARRTGATLVHPFDHLDVIAGQGTIGLEILEQCPNAATVLCPVGGGGLIAGLAAALKTTLPNVEVIGVQAEGADAFAQSLAAGERRTVVPATVADGIAVGTPGELTFDLVRELCDDVETVSDERIARAMLLALTREKLVVEPAGATAMAALIDRRRPLAGPVVVVLSGGNVDAELLLQILRHGQASAGRYQVLRLRLADRPGALASALAAIAAAGANVLHIEHEREAPSIPFGATDVTVHVETRDPERLRRATTALQVEQRSFSRPPVRHGQVSDPSGRQDARRLP
jgi:threonine dehydratase